MLRSILKQKPMKGISKDMKIFKKKTIDKTNTNVSYYGTEAFEQNRNKISQILQDIPTAKSPKGYKYKGRLAIGGFEYFGFSETSDILYVASTSGRGLFNLATGEKIARDYNTTDYYLDERLLITNGFDVLEGQQIKLASKYGGSLLPVSNEQRDMLVRVSPLYPCEDLIFQPAYENCFTPDGISPNITNKNCRRIYRGFLYCYGFSFSGKYFVIVDEGGMMYWEAFGVEDIYHEIRLAEVSQNAFYAATDYFEKIAPLCEKYPEIAHSLMRIAIRCIFYCGICHAKDVIAQVNAINKGNPVYLTWLSKNEPMIEMIVKELTVCCFFYDLKCDGNKVILDHKIKKEMAGVFVEIPDREIYQEFSTFEAFKDFIGKLYHEYDLKEDEIYRLILEEGYEKEFFSSDSAW